MPLFPRQVTSCRENGKKLKLVTRRSNQCYKLYEVEKQRTPCRYQEDQMDELEIIRLLKKCTQTGAKAGTKTSKKAVAKVLRMGYYLFLREQLGRTTGEDQKNYCNTVTGRWKRIQKKSCKADCIWQQKQVDEE